MKHHILKKRKLKITKESFNSQKAITYYKGKYLTYSLEDWSLIKKQSVDEIKEGGSYTFESCGDYIFVFDNNSGELLNTINIA